MQVGLLTTLRSLSIGAGPSSDKEFAPLERLTGLQHLVLSGPDHYYPACLSSLSNLTSIHIEEEPYDRYNTDGSWFNLARALRHLPALRKVDTPPFPEEMGALA